MRIIGLKSLDNDCVICMTLSSSERILNTLTMDILLNRLQRNRIVRKFVGYFAGGSIKLRVHHILDHASHCSWGFVPDDYVPHPELYEDGYVLVERDSDGNPLNVAPLPEFLQCTAAMLARMNREYAEMKIQMCKLSQDRLPQPVNGYAAGPEARKRSKERSQP